MGKETKIVFKNYQLMPLLNWLNVGALPGKLSRARTRFINLCIDRIKEIETTRLETIKKYAKKDKDKNPIIISDEGGKTKFDINEKGIKKFEEEYNEYMKEDFVIDVTASTKDTLQGVKGILINTLDEFSNDPKILVEKHLTPAMYDEICSVFEKYLK